VQRLQEARTGRPDEEHQTENLLKRDVTAKFHFNLQSGDLKGHFGGKGLRSRNGVRRDGLGDGVFNFALGIDSDRLEELAYAQIQGVFVHSGSPNSAEGGCESVAPMRGDFRFLVTVSDRAWQRECLAAIRRTNVLVQRPGQTENAVT